MSSPLDIDFVRSQFPALASDWAFFDNAGGSQILGRVVDRIAEFLLTSNVQLGASYAASRLASERVALGVRAMARLAGTPDESEIVLGSSTTQLLSNLASAVAPSLAPGDEIIVTDVDHESNRGPWKRLAHAGIVVKDWRVNPGSMRLELSDLEPLMGPRTRLVCFTHCSNVLGGIHPVEAITTFVHDRGAKVCVDGVAYAPHRALSVRAWDVDYYVFSTYKVYGPHAAVLYGKRAHLEHLANLNHDFLAGSVPLKLQPGNVNFELSFGLTGVVDYLDALASHPGPAPKGPTSPPPSEGPFERIALHEEGLAEALLAFLRTKKNVRILGEAASDRAARVPTISFVVDGVDSASLPPRVDGAKVAIRYGDFYARRLIETLGLAPQHGVVRVSMVHYNTRGEVDRLVAALDRCL